MQATRRWMTAGFPRQLLRCKFVAQPWAALPLSPPLAHAFGNPCPPTKDNIAPASDVSSARAARLLQGPSLCCPSIGPARLNVALHTLHERGEARGLGHACAVGHRRAHLVHPTLHLPCARKGRGARILSCACWHTPLVCIQAAHTHAACTRCMSNTPLRA